MNKRKETANKGFSLVELIIVVAIMAVLVGVLAPQYLKYVERSRQSTDKQNVDAIINAVRIYAIDPEVESAKQVTNGAQVTIKTNPETVGTTNATNNTNLALDSAGIKEIALKSSKWIDSTTNAETNTVTLTFTVETNGNISVTASVKDILE